MAKSTTKDMTSGSPMKLIVGFAVPFMFGLLFQQFYSVVDSIIVGRFLGVNALAAVGATGSLHFLIIGFSNGVCNGFMIPVTHKFGAKDYSGMRQFVANAVWLGAMLAIVLTVIVSVLCKEILLLMNTPEDILQDAYIYILIIFLGLPATYLYNMLAGIIRSMGDSKTPLKFLMLSSFLNIVLDLVCIVVLHMGVAGAAVATVVSQLVSGLLCLFYAKNKFELLQISKEEWKVNTGHMKVLCNMGIPMGLQCSVTAVGSVILQTAVNGLGSVAVAAVTASNKVSIFFCCPIDAMGSTMATYAGQNVGAGKLERLGKGIKSCAVLGILYSALAFSVLYFAGESLASLFIDGGEVQILANARQMLLTNSAFYALLVFVSVLRLTIQGAGFSMLAIMTGFFEMAARAIAGLVLVPNFGFTGVCFASPLAWVLANLFLIPAYIHVRRKLEKMLTVNT